LKSHWILVYNKHVGINRMGRGEGNLVKNVGEGGEGRGGCGKGGLICIVTLINYVKYRIIRIILQFIK
jgi:hypothetical protein